MQIQNDLLIDKAELEASIEKLTNKFLNKWSGVNIGVSSRTFDTNCFGGDVENHFVSVKVTVTL